MDHEQVVCAALERAARKIWSQTVVAGIANPALLDQIDRRIGDRPTPMRRLARTFGLTDAEIDQLWLLACHELEPSLGTARRPRAPASTRLEKIGLVNVDPELRASDRLVALVRQ